jgi:hypothetical protein
MNNVNGNTWKMKLYNGNNCIVEYNNGNLRRIGTSETQGVTVTDKSALTVPSTSAASYTGPQYVAVSPAESQKAG